VGKLDGKNKFNIKCPRCRKNGILRLKEKGRNSLIIYHYDHKKYWNGTSGTKTCYIGSMKTSAHKIFHKYFWDKENEEFKYFNKMWNKIQDNIQKDLALPQIEPNNEMLEKFASILNEIRKIKSMEEKSKKVKGQRLWWSIKCPKCRIGIQMHATFWGVDRKRPVGIYSIPSTHLHYKTVDTPNDITYSSFGIFQPFPAFF
jgi:hypothetical protein